jgi:HPt (histidine-containing phosphotransfer) domain-containing protein
MSGVQEGARGCEFDPLFLDAYTGGDTETRDQVLKLFLVQSHLLFGRLETSVGDPMGWGEAAHSLKGCARSVGANGVADLASRAESESSAPQTVQGRRLIELKLALETTSSQVEALIHGR